MTQKDYYKTLGVARDATQDQIKKAYRKMAQQFHPDVNKSPDAEAMMKAINEAYDVLSDPNKKAHYDQFGSTGPTYNSQSQQTHGQYGYTSFEDLFAEMLRQQRAQQSQRRTVYQSKPISMLGLFFRVMYGMFILNVIMNILMSMFRW